MLLSIALFLLVAVFVARPFILPRPKPPKLTQRQILEAEKDALLAQIRALDFDAETDKQDAEIYQLERERLLGQATAALQQLDETADVDQAIEAAIAKLRQNEQVRTDDGKNTRPCPNCSAVVKLTDRFCSTCGCNLQDFPEETAA